MRDQADDDGPIGRNRSKPNPGLQRLNAAFARAERESEQLRRLKVQYPQWSGLYFVPEGGRGYDRTEA